jgi:aminocarboxymuconate-semialdehyde decarboxylase
VPLFIHGVTNDGSGPVADARLRRFGLDLIVGYTYEETVAAASLLLGGVLDRHPQLDVCLSHGGGAIAFLAQRFDSMANFRGNESDFATSLGRLWFDSHLEPGRARDLVVDTVGVERMVYGTNFGGWDSPTETDDFDTSLTPNAHRLLRLGAPT